ncbi:hypothetical protein [Bacillus cereus group sp. BfR-BA-01511]|uniref:hypothetical protein n=1 Tax=Bacillus cereus group sp. BfR-BA-01511 TaxID=2920365 RepID=UPI001F578D37|nr:hypothetical protein [Bacillus cereus group sp. BfR-BA-01511]
MIIVIIIAVIIGYLFISSRDRKSAKTVVSKDITSRGGEVTDCIDWQKGYYQFIFDKKKKGFWYVTGQEKRFYDYHEILGCEMQIDGRTTVSTSRGTSIGGAIVGGIIGGGIGAIIGGVSGERKSIEEKKIFSAKLIVTVNDMERPYIEIVIASYLLPRELYYGDEKNALKWMKLLEVAMKQPNDESAQIITNQYPTKN